MRYVDIDHHLIPKIDYVVFKAYVMRSYFHFFEESIIDTQKWGR